MKTVLTPSRTNKVLIKKCHVCGQVHESSSELQKCVKCHKAFLPMNYFEKIHGTKNSDYAHLFAECHELEEDELIKGLCVIW